MCIYVSCGQNFVLVRRSVVKRLESTIGCGSCVREKNTIYIRVGIFVGLQVQQPMKSTRRPINNTSRAKYPLTRETMFLNAL